MRKSSFLLVLGTLFFPLIISANGGIKEVAEGKYIVQVSMAPIAPYTGDTQKMLIAVSDLLGNLIAKDIRMDVSLAYEDTQGGKDTTVAQQTNAIAHNGVLPFDYTYADAGIYKLLVKFRLPEELSHTYEPEDFHIEAKAKYADSPPPPQFFLIPVLLAAIGGLGVGYILGKRHA